MLQTECMPYLVRRNKTNSTGHILILKGIEPGTRVNRCRLYLHPGMQQSHHIMPPHHIGFNNFTGTGINHRRSHRIRLLGSSISNHRIPGIINIKIRIIRRSIFRHHSILKACSLKSFLPVKYSRFYRFTPLRRSCRIYIKYNRFNRFHQFPAFILFHIFRFGLQTPTMHQLPLFHRLLFIIKINMRRGKKAHSIVSKPGFHRLLRQ